MRRNKLSEIDNYLHCSIIGTCFTLKEAESLAKTILNYNVKELSDYDIHSSLIKSVSGSLKISNKITERLNCKFRKELFETDKLKTESQLLKYWDEAFNCGVIPGAYWALMSHTKSGLTVKKQIFGQLHMHNHEVNKSDIKLRKSLTDSESNNRLLQEKLLDKSLQISNLLNDISALNKRAENQEEELHQLRHINGDLKSYINRVESSNDQVKNYKVLEQRNSFLEDKVVELKREIENLQRVNFVLEKPLCQSLLGDNEECPCSNNLNNQLLLFVGGRPSRIPHYKGIVEKMNGRFLYHDGGKEQSSLLLQNQALNADIVVCALDCVSHDATKCVKRVCRKAGQKIIMLKKSGLETFTKELQRVV